MDITHFAIEKKRITAVALAVIFFAGVNAYNGMSRNEDPGFIIRTAMVQTFFPGASPERMELLVTDKLEKTIQEMPELDSVRSNSRVGISVIYVDIKESYKEMRPIWDKLRRKVDSAVGDLPEGVIGPFVNDEFGDVFGTIISVTGDGFESRELEDIAEEVRNELLLIAEVAKVEIYGAREERIFVEYDNSRLAEFGLSPIELQRILQSRNIVLPGGDFSTPFEKIVLEPSGNYESLDELRRTVINVPGRRDVLRLQDLVNIRRGYEDPPDTLVRTTGEPSLMLAVSLREGGNILDMGHSVRAVIDRARGIYPIGVEFDELQFQADIVDKKIDDFTSNVLQAVTIVVLVMLAFLGLRTGLIVASLIPMTIAAALFVMGVFGIGLDQMSLASLIIALGMLVDNAIVMSESIMVEMEGGKSAKQAAIDSASELRMPLLIASLTTAAAFLPIYLAESTTGEYTAPLFKVVTITLLCSWVIALTFIPLLCVSFLKVQPSQQTFDTRFYNAYRGLLLAMLHHRWVSLAAVIAIFFIAMQGFQLVPNIFFPPNDRPTFTIEFELPEGSPIERTDEVVRETEQFMLDNLMASEDTPGIDRWGTFVGSGAPRFILSYNPEPTAPNYALVMATTTDLASMKSKIIPSIERFILDQFPDVNPTVRPLPLGAPAWPPVSIRISGREDDTLFSFVDETKQRLREVPGARQIADNWGVRSKKVIVEIDEARARRAGVSHQDIAVSLQTFLTGLETTEFREDDKLIPIVMRSERSGQVDPHQIGALNVYSQAMGSSVPLSQVAEPRVVWQPARIQRRDRVRTVNVEALTAPGVTAAEVNAAIEPWLVEHSAKLPFGFGWEFGGEAETSGKANASIAAKLPIAGLIILLLLVGQFDSLRRPAIILITIPLGLIGVIFGLLVARSYFGFMTLLGIISLAGIVINNAIVLLDRIRIEIEDTGRDPADAVVHAAQQRLRPILLTTATTAGGMMPLWLGGGPMWEPMAIGIIFGLSFATILTLGVVPVLYSLFFRVSFR
ncbi:MAG: efflux RND transporter permease subunit [Gammaproteobacteria bacterium]|nr:efflux RND transporter permease subunit [Gammaproteobacteria bacterium]